MTIKCGLEHARNRNVMNCLDGDNKNNGHGNA